MIWIGFLIGIVVRMALELWILVLLAKTELTEPRNPAEDSIYDAVKGEE